MKTLGLTIIICALLINPCLASDVLVSGYPKKEDVHNIQELCQWLKSFQYHAEDLGEEKSIDDTIMSKGGVCIHFAKMIQSILKGLGYNAKVIGLVYGQGHGHAVCVFEESDGTFSLFSNTDYVNAHTTNIEAFLKFCFPETKRITLL